MRVFRGNRPRGQALVEFALLFPVFLFLLLIAIDVGRLFFSEIEINNAAREGASYAATNPTDSAGIQQHVVQETNAQSQRGAGTISAPTVTCSDPSGTIIACSAATGGTGSGNTVQASVTEPFTFFTPLINGFFNNSFNMGASATAVVLGYAASTSATPPPTCGVPTASFIVVVSNLTITTDPSASTPNSGVCNISGYNWDWGDGNSEPGTASATTHTYLVSGTYAVTLTTTNQGGSATSSQSVPVGVPPPPTCTKPAANFTYTSNKKVYTYTDTSTVADPANCPITAWAWTFDDGNQSNAQNPTYTYGTGGSHTATLVVTNAGGSSSVGPK
jgi:PKD repeat protein